MTEAPATGTNFYVMHIGGATQSSTVPPGGSTVPGAFGVSGDLTVDTSTLKVDSTNNRVGIGTSSPASLMHLSSTVPTLSFTDTNSFTDANDRFIVRASTDRGNIQWYDDSASTTTELMTFLPAGNVGIGTSSPLDDLHVVGNGGGKIRIGETTTRYTQIQGAASGSGLEADTLFYNTNSSGTSTVNLTLTGSGRGLSQFTAKAWMRYDQDHNILRDSHNVSSVTDHSLGVFTMVFANNMGNNHYCVQGSGHYGGSTNDMGLIQWATEGDLTTSSAKFYFMSQINNGTSGALYDAEEAMILIFGD
jgi:hypothetical protein